MKHWHAGSLGADGEDYRAEYVHAPFPKISTQHRDCLLKGQGPAVVSLRKCLTREASMTVTHNPKAAADQARAAYRKTTDHLGHLGLDTALQKACAPLPRRL